MGDETRREQLKKRRKLLACMYVRYRGQLQTAIGADDHRTIFKCRRESSAQPFHYNHHHDLVAHRHF